MDFIHFAPNLITFLGHFKIFSNSLVFRNGLKNVLLTSLEGNLKGIGQKSILKNRVWCNFLLNSSCLGNDSTYKKIVIHKKDAFIIKKNKNSNIFKEHGVINISVSYLILYNFNGQSRKNRDFTRC